MSGIVIERADFYTFSGENVTPIVEGGLQGGIFSDAFRYS